MNFIIRICYKPFSVSSQGVFDTNGNFATPESLLLRSVSSQQREPAIALKSTEKPVLATKNVESVAKDSALKTPGSGNNNKVSEIQSKGEPKRVAFQLDETAPREQNEKQDNETAPLEALEEEEEDVLLYEDYNLENDDYMYDDEYY
jgi:hypothetical protein